MKISLKKRERCEVCRYWQIRIDKELFEFSVGACKKIHKKRFCGSNSAVINAIDDIPPVDLLTGEEFCCSNFETRP